jgi:hypothetical protein
LAFPFVYFSWLASSRQFTERYPPRSTHYFRMLTNGTRTGSGKLIGPICDAVKDGASQSDVAEASKIIDGNDAKQTGDSDNNDDDSAANGLVPNSLLALAVALFFL